VLPVLNPFWNAVISVKGLNEEPGWRWPLVARLKGSFWKSLPPTIALTPPVLLSMTTTEAVGSMPASVL
jgi:hypothetical protein